MTTHRAGGPDLSRQEVVDSSDVYAFVSPDRPDQVTLIATFAHAPRRGGGADFSDRPEHRGDPDASEFCDDVLYEIHVSNRPGARADVTYQFRFHTKVHSDETPPYGTDPVTSLAEANENRPQYYAVSRLDRGRSPVLLRAGLAVPPGNIWPIGPAGSRQLTEEAVHSLPGDCQVFAGRRDCGPSGGRGAILDLGSPSDTELAGPVPSALVVGLTGLQRPDVPSIAIQVPICDLTRSHTTPTHVMHGDSVIGVWATASQQRSRIFDSHSERTRGHGPFIQVSRSGNPLFSELIVPHCDKERWNALPPRDDNDFAGHVSAPELARLLPELYAGGFPNLAAYVKPRADLRALLLTGIPIGAIPGFQNFTGSKHADMLRLNLAVPPSHTPHELGLLAGDPAGFPNGRRVDDDVVTVQLRAIAGHTIPLVDSAFTPDAAALAFAAGVPAGGNRRTRSSSSLSRFPYLGDPEGELQTAPATYGHAHPPEGSAGAGRASRRARQGMTRQSRSVSASPAST
jgi:hypothetical protein